MTGAGREASHLAVTVVPRASRNRIESLEDGAWRIHLTAPPVDGAANDALLKLLAAALDVPRSRLSIATGLRGRRKRVLVDGVSPDVLDERLRQAALRQR